MKTKKTVFWFLFILFVGKLGVAHDNATSNTPTIPHLFATGDVIDATKFNENFQFLLDQIFQNSNTQYVYANGVKIGTFKGYIAGSDIQYLVQNDKGFLFPVKMNGEGGRNEDFGYSEESCLGDRGAIAQYPDKTILSIYGNFYYTTTETIPLKSLNQGSTASCSNDPGLFNLPENVSKVFANDPSLTGFAGTDFDVPITIGP